MLDKPFFRNSLPPALKRADLIPTLPLAPAEVLNMLVLAYSYLRFSSSEQRKGNSFDRQIRGRDHYIAKKGLTLDSSFIIEDAGVSAFRGVTAATGALRVFLDACEQKRIRPG